MDAGRHPAPRRSSYALASLATALVAPIALGEWSGLLRPHYGFLTGAVGTVAGRVRQWTPVACYLAAFACAMYVTTYVAASVAADLRQRESQLMRTDRGPAGDRPEADGTGGTEIAFHGDGRAPVQKPAGGHCDLLQAAASGQVSPEKQKDMLDARRVAHPRTP